jgi:hypothetical protein
MDRRDDHVRLCGQEPVNKVRAEDRFGLRAAIISGFGPEASEGEKRAVVIESEPNNALLIGLGIGLAAERFSVVFRACSPGRILSCRPRRCLCDPCRRAPWRVVCIAPVWPRTYRDALE